MFATTFALRIVFLGFVVYTLISANARPDIYGKPLCYNYVCINWDSWRQLSTFTRWSWCLIIAYFALLVFASTLRVLGATLRGAPSRFPAPWSFSRGFFEFLYVNAAFIGVIVYCVLIPLVRWKGVVPRTDGTAPTAAQIRILLESWQEHSMHLGASLLLEVERRLLKSEGVLLRFSVSGFWGWHVPWMCSYFAFAVWLCETTNGFVHYPFLDYRTSVLRFVVGIVAVFALSRVAWWVVGRFVGDGGTVVEDGGKTGGNRKKNSKSMWG